MLHFSGESGTFLADFGPSEQGCKPLELETASSEKTGRILARV